MRHGRRRPNSFLSSISKPSPSPPPPPPPADLPNLLLVASLSKTLASSSTRLLDSFPIPISQSLVLQILRKNSLTPSIKIEFFHWASLGPNYKHSAVMFRQNSKESLVLHAASSFSFAFSSDSRRYRNFRVCMRHGRRRPNSFLSSISKPSPSPPPPPPPADLPNLLLVASLSKTLASSSTRLLDSFPIPISQSLVLQILRKNSLTPSIKIEFFHWASLGPNYKHSAVTYSQLFRALCRAGRLADIPPLLRFMKQDGVVVDSPTFKLLLDAFIRSGKFDFALELLDYMEELGIRLDPDMYNSVLAALIKKKPGGSCSLDLVGGSDGDGSGGFVVPDVVSCNELLVALRKADMREEFKRVFEKFAREGVSV
ncbi:Pentatricopeptide repeat [Cinnamomum micranthum f. kanehirae]|uniref:Pentatricopeptide repeat n=1 Tax=Cinnamomum micranthum f. kanehirae TaxID=337451 RepID=A0A3S3NPR0_9MAGN|nr:Pentatricopeptide repeat [Cinnamomum micranthum f. kanehirae]